MLATALASSRSTFAASRARHGGRHGVDLTARRRSRVVRVARPPRLAPARAEETADDTTRGDLDVRAEAIIEEVERGGGDPTELLRRDVSRDVDTPEPARDSPRDTFAERVRRRGQEGSSSNSFDEALERSDHDPTAGSAFERPSAASDLAWERLAGDIEKVQDDAAIHYAKYEGAKRAAADRATAQGKPAAVEKNEEGRKGWRNETTDGPRPATAEPAPLPTTNMYEEARKRYEVFTGHPAGRRRHTPKSADAKSCVCRCGSVLSNFEHMFDALFSLSAGTGTIHTSPRSAGRTTPRRRTTQRRCSRSTTHPTPRSTP